jgi:hypothetical protein
MDSYLGTDVDFKNIDLSKTLFDLRQDLDIHCLISANAEELQKRHLANIFQQIRRRAIAAIVLGICKIYEPEKRFELNSIAGIMKSLIAKSAKPRNSSHLKVFILKYDNDSISAVSTNDLLETVERFKMRFARDLGRLKTARDKVIAHSEFLANVEDVPSYDVMERLFIFGAEFYEVIAHEFVGVGPDDLKTNRPIKISFQRLLSQLGLTEIRTDLL